MNYKLTKAGRLIFTLVPLCAFFLALSFIFLPGRAFAPAPAATDSFELPGVTDPVPSPAPAATDGADEETSEPPEGDDRVTVQMEPSDIHGGSLILVNHEHHYEIPDDSGLVAVVDVKTSSYRVSNKNIPLSVDIIERLNDMMDAFYAETGAANVTVISGFRDYDHQKRILDERIALVGREEASRWVSEPGHSEHHTGLAIDFGIYENGINATFRAKGKYAWLEQNSYKYGFIRRYDDAKSDITKIAYEPWHYRYVGEPHAYFIYKNDWCFEEYVGFIMKHTADDSYRDVYNDVKYEIYYTRETEITVPKDAEYWISGNNIGGFIVTVEAENSAPRADANPDDEKQHIP